MKPLMSVVNILAFPLIVLNTLGSFISGIWLATLGEWATIGFGLLILVVAPRFLRWSLQFVLPLNYFLNKGKAFGMIVSATLTSVYTVLLMTIWCCGIFFLFITWADASDFIPHLIWSYGIAISPWGFLASKERENFDFAISTFFAELAYITLMLFVLFTTINVYDALKIFAVFMVIALTLEILMAVMSDSEQKKLAGHSAPVA